MSTALEIHIGQTAQGAYIAFTVTAVKIRNNEKVPYRNFGTVAQNQLLNSFKTQARDIVAFMEGKSCERLTIFNGSALTPECRKPLPYRKNTDRAIHGLLSRTLPHQPQMK